MKTIGNYSLEKIIEYLPHGEVWLCKRMTTGEDFTCRVVSKYSMNVPGFYDHFKNELILQGHIAHMGIVKLVDVAQDMENIFLFWEYNKNGTLNDAVISKGGFSEQEARVYFKQIMQVLVYLHSLNIAHRDIKLDNIEFSDNNTIQFTGFGLSKIQKEGDLLLTSCGTLVYAAPEVIKEEPYDGYKADIWSAGIVLFALISGHLPWSTNPDESPEAVVVGTATQIVNGDFLFPEGMSLSLQNLLTYMLNLDPDERPSAEEILQHPWMEEDSTYINCEPLEPDPKLEASIRKLIEQLESRHK